MPQLSIPDAPRHGSMYFSAPCPRPYHVEIWCEKSTVNDVLLPLAERYGLNIQTAVGEISVTLCRELVERTGARPVRILYLSDFDPAGQSMPVAAARKIEFFARKYEDEAGIALDIQLHPIVLTHDQCLQYELPRTPIKETERRSDKFEAQFGEGATGLDALEAVHEGELQRILEREIEKFHSPGFADEWRAAREEAESYIDEIKAEIFERHAEAADALEQQRTALQSLADEGIRGLRQQTDERIAELRTLADDRLADLQALAAERLADLRAQAADRLTDLQVLADEQMAPLIEQADELVTDLKEQADQLVADERALCDRINHDLEAEKPDLDGFDWPEPPEGWEDPLLDTTRGYVEQVDRFKDHQGKPTERKKRAPSRKRYTITRVICGTAFMAALDHAKFCSGACRAKADNRRGAVKSRAKQVRQQP